MNITYHTTDMKYFRILIFVLLCSLKAQGQGGEAKWIEGPTYSYNFNIPEVVYVEAEQRSIVSDRIDISFTIDAKCQFGDFVVKPGKLKSFGEWAKKNPEEIIREWLKNHPCSGNGKKEVFHIPIKIVF